MLLTRMGEAEKREGWGGRRVVVHSNCSSLDMLRFQYLSYIQANILSKQLVCVSNQGSFWLERRYLGNFALSGI